MEHRNLRRALLDKHISIKAYAQILGVTEKTAQNKLGGKTDFTLSEYRETCSLLPEYNAEYLFAEARKEE